MGSPDYLPEHGRVLPGLTRRFACAHSWQVGGAAVGSGSHGSSAHDGTLADLIQEMRLVRPDGSVVDLADPRTQTEEQAVGSLTTTTGGGAGVAGSLSLYAARLSLGLLGVAVRLRLRCIKAYHVRLKPIETGEP